MGDKWALIIAAVVMFIGLSGTILPIIPGIPLIFLAALGYGIYNNFVDLPVITIIILLALTLISFIVDYLAGVLGAKKYGSTRWGIWGSIIGVLVGMFILPPLGIVIGPLVGAVIGEMVAGKKPQEALRVGWGTLVGMAGGALVKIIIGLTMIIYFFIQVLWR